MEKMEFVPEIDTASLGDAVMKKAEAAVAAEAEADNASRDEAAASAPGTAEADVEQAMASLPTAVAQRIAELIENADAAGYLRGRNEAIEASRHFDGGDETAEPAPFPRYARRSMWE